MPSSGKPNTAPDSSASSLIAVARDTPWRAINELRRRLAWPLIRRLLRLQGMSPGRDWRVFGMPIVQRHRQSTIALGARAELRSWRASNPLVPHHPVVLATRAAGAAILVGDDCGMTGSTIVAAELVRIGHRVLLGANTTIVDTDFHPLTAEGRARDILAGAHAPVIIEDDVFVGMGSMILKGVTVGRGSVIGAGSVVTKSIPPGVIAAGNPARVVRAL